MVLTRLAATLLEFVRVPLAVRECAVKDGSGPTGWQNCSDTAGPKIMPNQPMGAGQSVMPTKCSVEESGQGVLYILPQRYIDMPFLMHSFAVPRRQRIRAGPVRRCVSDWTCGLRHAAKLVARSDRLGCPSGPAHGCAGRTRRRKRAALGRCVLPRSCWRAAWAEGSRSSSTCAGRPHRAGMRFSPSVRRKAMPWTPSIGARTSSARACAATARGIRYAGGRSVACCGDSSRTWCRPTWAAPVRLAARPHGPPAIRHWPCCTR